MTFAMHVNMIRSHHSNNLIPSQKRCDCVVCVSGNSKSALDIFRSQDSELPIGRQSSQTSHISNHDSLCSSIDCTEPVAVDDGMRIIRHYGPLHVPSPIPIPSFELSTELAVLHKEALHDIGQRYNKRPRDTIENFKTSIVTNAKHQHCHEKMTGLKRSKTFRNGLYSQGSLSKQTNSVHKKDRKPTKTSKYEPSILASKTLSRICLEAKSCSFSKFPSEKFKVPNPLEPDTVPAVIQIPCSPPCSPLEGYPDDVSELGLDDHETGHDNNPSLGTQNGSNPLDKQHICVPTNMLVSICNSDSCVLGPDSSRQTFIPSSISVWITPSVE